MNRFNKVGAAATGVLEVITGIGGVRRRLRPVDLRDRVVLITGGSRGLGLALAREFARQGSRVAICARDAEELERARADIARLGVDVLAKPCDVTDKVAVEALVQEVGRQLGPIDILVNNAGIMTVGPVESQAIEDFEQAHAVMYWGVVYPTLAVLKEMKARRSGRIVNITSIGGRVSVPHFLPYTSAKFAAVGFSEGLRAELLEHEIYVTTVVPGLMRTGWSVNALYKGDAERELHWFSRAVDSPLVAMGADRAARRIVRATRTGAAEVVLSPQAKLLSLLHGVFPGLTTDVLAMANRLLPEAKGPERVASRRAAQSAMSRAAREAGRQLNQPV